MVVDGLADDAKLGIDALVGHLPTNEGGARSEALTLAR